jgi:hypothetical protein
MTAQLWLLRMQPVVLDLRDLQAVLQTTAAAVAKYHLAHNLPDIGILIPAQAVAQCLLTHHLPDNCCCCCC